MTIQRRGPDGIQQRIQEIQARIASLKPPKAEVAPPSTLLTGPIVNRPLEGAVAPVNPFGPGVTVDAPRAPGSLQSLIQQAAVSAKIDPMLFEALVGIESGFNPKATSAAGAQGLAQLMPGTAKLLGVSDPFDPSQNLNAGAKYLGQMLNKFGDVRLALAAYNAGPGAVVRHRGVPPFAETNRYIDRVMRRAAAIGGGIQP